MLYCTQNVEIMREYEALNQEYLKTGSETVHDEVNNTPNENVSIPEFAT